MIILPGTSDLPLDARLRLHEFYGAALDASLSAASSRPSPQDMLGAGISRDFPRTPPPAGGRLSPPFRFAVPVPREPYPPFFNLLLDPDFNRLDAGSIRHGAALEPGAEAPGRLWARLWTLPYAIAQGIGRLLWLPFQWIGIAASFVVRGCTRAATPVPPGSTPRAPHHQPTGSNTRRSPMRQRGDAPSLMASAASVASVASPSAGSSGAAAKAAAATHATSTARMPRVHVAPAVAYADPPICPISFKPLTNAVTTSCQHAFDHEAMAMWLEQGHRDCPCCNAPVSSDTLRDDHDVRQYAASWLHQHAPGAHTQAQAPGTSQAHDAAFGLWLQQAQRRVFVHPPECPISAEPFTEAVKTPCGHAFERSSITQWLRFSRPNCPCCRAPVYPDQLRADRALSQYAALWLKAGSPQDIPDAPASAPVGRTFLSPQDLGMPEELTCAFSRVPLQDPVIAPCGHTFERSSIVDVLKQEHRCPLDNQITSPQDLRSDGQATRSLVNWQLQMLRSMSSENWGAIYCDEDFAYA